MAHFGVLSYKGIGHLNPLIALWRELVARGHRVTLFQHPELEQHVRARGLEFFPIDIPGSSYTGQPRGTNQPKPRPQIGEIAYRLQRIEGDMGAFLGEYHAALRIAGVDTLIMGEISLAGP